MKSGKNRKIVFIVLSVFILTLLAVGLCAAGRYNLLPKKTCTAERFGITPLRGSFDFNGNGTDDYTDFLLGARKDAENHPKYDGSCLDGGFPPDNTGVCTDVIRSCKACCCAICVFSCIECTNNHAGDTFERIYRRTRHKNGGIHCGE